MRKEMIMKAFVVMAVAVSVMVGCDREETGAGGTAPAATAVALPAGLKLEAAPEGAKEVAAVKAEAREGERVVVKGKVAGQAEPIAANRAILTLLDSSIKTCDQTEGDACATPWDACCEPGDEIAKNALTVQVVDAQGQPLKASLAGVEGVKPLANVTVTGKAKRTPDGVLLVEADGVHVNP